MVRIIVNKHQGHVDWNAPGAQGRNCMTDVTFSCVLWRYLAPYGGAARDLKPTGGGHANACSFVLCFISWNKSWIRRVSETTDGD